MVKTIDTHSFEDQNINEGGWILDAGARGFSFSKYFLGKGNKLIALEPDKKCVPDFINDNFYLYYEALYDRDEIMTYSTWSTGEGNMVHDDDKYTSENYSYQQKSKIQSHTLDYYMDKHSIEIFELIKLDIEGSEYKFLEWYAKNKKILTKQFSIEFHDFTGRNEHENFNYDTINLGWFNENYKCIRSDKLDSVFILK